MVLKNNQIPPNLNYINSKPGLDLEERGIIAVYGSIRLAALNSIDITSLLSQFPNTLAVRFY